MSDIVTCKCGASIRLPTDSKNRRFRCPQCKTGIALTVDARVLSAALSGPDSPGAMCSICQSVIEESELVVTCPECDQAHHSECWAEVGGCGSYGCKQAPSPEKDDASAQGPLSAWGDDKNCPVCGETIKAIALKCRYCGSEFGTVDPLSLGDLHRRDRKDESLKSLQRTVIAIFILSMIGCLAPIIAIVSMCVILPKREQLAKEGPLYLTLGYSSIALSVIYSILILFFAIF